MESLRPDLARLRELLGQQGDLRQAIVFGSVAAGRARADSDLDIAVAADGPLTAAHHVALVERLAAECGRPVDLIDLKTVGQPLLGQILAHGQRLLGSDVEYAELVRRNIFDAEDFLPYVRRILRERRQRWIR